MTGLELSERKKREMRTLADASREALVALAKRASIEDEEGRQPRSGKDEAAFEIVSHHETKKNVAKK